MEPTTKKYMCRMIKNRNQLMDGKIGEVIRFAIVGVLATAIQYGVYWCGLHIIPLSWMGSSQGRLATLSMTLGYGISFVFNFLASTRYTFKVKANAKRGAGFVFSHVVNYLLQMVTLNFFIWLGVGVKVAPVPMFCVCVPINFLLVRFFLKK